MENTSYKTIPHSRALCVTALRRSRFGLDVTSCKNGNVTKQHGTRKADPVTGEVHSLNRQPKTDHLCFGPDATDQAAAMNSGEVNNLACARVGFTLPKRSQPSQQP